MASVYPVFTYRHGDFTRPNFRDDANCNQHGKPYGSHLFLWIHERRNRIPALLRFLESVFFLHVGIGGCNEHIPNVRILGISRRILLFVNRILLHKSRSNRSQQKGVHRHPVCRPRLLNRYPHLRILHGNIYIHPGRGADDAIQHDDSLGIRIDVCRWCR